MYFFEQAVFQGQIRDKDIPQELYPDDLELIRSTGYDKSGIRCFRLCDSVSDTPRARGSLYRQTSRYLYFRTTWEEKRGYITLFAVLSGILALTAFGHQIMHVKALIAGAFRTGTPYGLLEYIMSTLIVIMLTVFPGAYLFAAYKFFRLELFVQRRLLVRFDRINRKVYLHRPRYAGGVVALDWDKVINEPLKEGAQFNMGLQLCWYPMETPHGRLEISIVGRPSRTMTELDERWEFIRRFMEEGPHAVPREKLIGKIPWPWQSVITELNPVWAHFVIPEMRWGIVPILLMLPAALFCSFFHWLSLLLCWEPVFPRAIRKACGESWLEVVEARIIDFFAWLMLAGIIWWWWPELRSLVVI